MDYHADIGTRVHHLIFNPQDEEDEVKEVLRCLNAWEEFVTNTEADILLNEVYLVGTSDEDDDIGFAGTLDCVADIPNEGTVLIEVKTSRVLHNAHAYQASAYAHMWEQLGGKKIDQVWVLRLGKYDGLYDPRPVKREKAFAAFLAARTLFMERDSEEVWNDWE